MHRSLVLAVLVTPACGGPPPPAPATASAAAPSPSPAAAPDDTIVASWRDLEPRLHAVYHGQLDVVSSDACARDLRIVAPPRVSAPAKLCTPLGEVVAWHTGHAVALPTGPGLWIVTTKDPAGTERVAAAAGAAPGATALDDAARSALASQYRCGQLALRWRIPPASQTCTADADCRLFASACFAAAVAVRDAAPYDELFRLAGGTCPDPTGGMCPPAQAARCVEGRCTPVWP